MIKCNCFFNPGEIIPVQAIGFQICFLKCKKCGGLVEEIKFDIPPFKKVYSDDVRIGDINLTEITSKHKTGHDNTPTGARHCVFEGVVEVEK